MHCDSASPWMSARWVSGQIHRDGVDQQIIRRGIQLFDGAAHGQARGLQDIDAIDLEGVGCGHGPGHGAFANPNGQYLAALGIQQFAIAQAADGAIWRKNDGGGEHGSEQRAATHFVDSGDALETLGPGIALVFSLALSLLRRVDGAERRTIRVRGDGLLCPSAHADSRVWRGARGRCAPRRCGRSPGHAAGKCAPRLGQS